MLNTNINYPYPVVKSFIDDYNNTIFTGDLKVEIGTNCYIVTPNFSINNDELANMIDKGNLTYAIEIQCTSTWFRKLYKIKNNQKFTIESCLLHERVEITPCIISCANINNFQNDDFIEDYEGILFNINIGDIVGIGEKRTFDAYYDNDIIKSESSIINIVKGSNKNEIECDFEGNIIQIYLPDIQFNEYKECGCMKDKHVLLNAVLVIPVLVKAIGIIEEEERQDSEENVYQNKSWYKTIVANLKRHSNNDQKKYKQLLENSVTSAEILLGNNYISALRYIKGIN